MDPGTAIVAPFTACEDNVNEVNKGIEAQVYDSRHGCYSHKDTLRGSGYEIRAVAIYRREQKHVVLGVYDDRAASK